MGEIKVKVSDETERKFREAAMRTFGYSKGSLSAASEKAFADWVGQNEMAAIREMAYEDGVTDPIKAIEGILKHVKKRSVELKHEASKIRGERYKHVRDRR